MKAALIAKLLPVLVGACGLFFAARWTLSQPQIPPIVLRVPGLDGRPDVSLASVKALDLRGTTTPGDARPADNPVAGGSWPHFRGPNLDNIVPDTQPLAETWPASGPPHLWEVATGEGYAGPAILNGRVYLMDYDQEKHADLLRCISLDDGRTIWNRSYPIVIKRDHGMSRTVPAVTDKFVVTIGPKCHVSCVDARSGEFRWGIDLVADYNTEVPLWYTGQNPLIDGDRLIVAPCGPDAFLMAVDLASGKVLWKSPNPNHWYMGYSSVVPMDLCGQRVYMYIASGRKNTLGAVVAVSAADGAILWESTDWRLCTAVPVPIQIGADTVFFSGDSATGCMLMKFKKTDKGLAHEILWRLPGTTFGAVQQTPILFKDHIYGVIPGGQLACLDIKTGTLCWNSGKERFGYGPYIICNDKIFAMNDSGSLTLADASPDAFHMLARWTVIPGAHESWGPIAIADGKMLVRDLRRLVCLDLRQGAP